MSISGFYFKFIIMKSLKLTDEQINKILEMGIYFYPEYNKEGFNWGMDLHIPSNSYFLVINKDDGAIWIHWFEFVTEHLYFKVYTEENSYIDYETTLMSPFGDNWFDEFYANFQKVKK